MACGLFLSRSAWYYNKFVNKPFAVLLLFFVTDVRHNNQFTQQVFEAEDTTVTRSVVLMKFYCAFARP
jgi:hypothetical protein